MRAVLACFVICSSITFFAWHLHEIILDKATVWSWINVVFNPFAFVLGCYYLYESILFSVQRFTTSRKRKRQVAK